MGGVRCFSYKTYEYKSGYLHPSLSHVLKSCIFDVIIKDSLHAVDSSAKRKNECRQSQPKLVVHPVVIKKTDIRLCPTYSAHPKLIGRKIYLSDKGVNFFIG